VIVPGLEEAIADTVVTDGTAVVDGTLTLSTRSFGRRDIVTPKGLPPIGAVVLELAPWSGPLAITVRTVGGQVLQPVFLEPGGWRTPANPVVQAADGPVRVELRDGSAWIDGRPVSSADPGVVELSVQSAETGTQGAAIRSLRFEDTGGKVLLETDFSPPDPGLVDRALVALAGAVLAAALTSLVLAAPVAGSLMALLLLAVPVLILLAPFSTWRQLCMQLYIVDTPAVVVRRLALVVAVVPLLGAGLLGSGLLVLGKARRALPVPVAGVVLGVVAILASRGLTGPWLLAALPGVALLAVPLWTARRAEQPLGPVLARDLPALGAVAAGTWAFGLLPALVWRLMCLTADAPVFNRIAPRAGVDAFLITLLALPVGAEVALRGTGLPDMWARARADTTDPETPFSVFWRGTCGTGTPATVYYFGGSSVGGAYQFRDHPEAFFAARTHTALCQTGTDRALTTLNYGHGGRDSWDIARAAGALYDEARPTVTVLYLGVNDLLTADHPLTRKQRAARERGASTGGSLATVQGLALLLGPSWTDDAPVAAVPIDDAEQNLRTIARATTAAGGHLVLVPEYTQQAVAPKMAPYYRMERRLAEELDGVTWVDLDAALAENSKDTLLADRNHLTHAGSERVSQVLAAALAPLLPP
jgi:lysophospholipase L1-like esterase